MIDKRLAAAAAFVRKDSPACDVGTDHGYLAAYLLEQGITSRVTASDVNQKPLEAARRTAEERGLSGKMKLLRSDGLAGIPAEDARDILICGMGGELIARIVLSCPYTRDAGVRLILQPMTQAAFLRQTLCGQGFRLLEETPVLDGKHRYTVMLWEYGGTPRDVGMLYSAVGEIPRCGTPEAEEYIRGEWLRAKKIASGLSKGGKQSEAGPWQKLASELEGLLAQAKG